MKNTILLTLLTSINICYGQTIAGFPNSGSTIINSNILITSTTVLVGDSTNIDIDCDNTNDIKLVVMKGPTIIDGANRVSISSTNSLFEICSKNQQANDDVKLYNQGDTLNCTSPYSWLVPNNSVFAAFGCMGCLPPYSCVDTFIAFRKNLGNNNFQNGWLNVSFNIYNPAPTLTLKKYTSFCFPSSTTSLTSWDRYTILPSVINDCLKIISSNATIFSVRIIDLSGNIIYSQKNLTEKEVYINATNLKPGLLIVEILDKQGIVRFKKIKY